MTEEAGGLAGRKEKKEFEKMSDVREKIKGKRVLVWGYGREGKSTEDFLKKYCEPECIDIFEGKKEDIDEEKYDLIFKSPGIIMDEDDPKYTSQTEVFLEQYRDNVIGITGTKGKSTTSSMLYEVLKGCLEREVLLVGNIGIPCLDHFGNIKEDTVVVFEMSCHQLAHVRVSPHIAVFLNLFEEHLDYYKTMDKYFNAKANITRYQKKGDHFLSGENVPYIETKAERTVIKGDEVRDYGLKILGKHNNINAEFVKNIACGIFMIAEDDAVSKMQDFEGLPHRIQYIGTKDGVLYYDDSISTIPGATIEAAACVPNLNTILVGGMDRGIDYEILVQFIKENDRFDFILSYESGKRIYDEIGERKNCHYKETLEEAVKYAKEITPKGRACVLSPAAASYGYFKNFEHRGDEFKRMVFE